MFPTTLVYSSHNRCEYIHRHWIVERALQSYDNKTILYLTMSMRDMHNQEYTWNTFSWYFERFRQWGLYAIPFFWRPELKKDDVELLFHYLSNFEVVILGGGNSYLGIERYRELGERFFGNRDLFQQILEDRQKRGKLTVGFSAGADQLSEYLVSGDEIVPGFSLANNITLTLHHEWGREGSVYELARRFPHCMAFGLPNDSGIALDQGYLRSGNFWQVIEFLIDCSWDVPEDGWHIKTRQGVKIQHFYSDGRHWAFNGGDKMLRIISPDYHYYGVWAVVGGQLLEYWSQQPSQYPSIDYILKQHS